jgi:putative peptidoglycan lipid II flippase
LRRDGVARHGSGWMWLLGRVLIANAVMGAVLVQLERPGGWWLQVGLFDRITWLAVSIVAGASAYFIVLFILGMRAGDFRLRQS